MHRGLVEQGARGRRGGRRLGQWGAADPPGDDDGDQDDDIVDDDDYDDGVWANGEQLILQVVIMIMIMISMMANFKMLFLKYT